jgi:hypothetical protein
MAFVGTADTPLGYLKSRTRWHWSETVFWLATLLPFYFFPDYLQLASQIAITDEPFEGLAPVIVDELTEALKRMLADRRLAINLVEAAAVAYGR